MTRANGSYQFDDGPSGDHTLDVDLPRSTRAVTSLPTPVRTVAGTPSQVPLVIAPRPVAAHLNLGSIDFLPSTSSARFGTSTATRPSSRPTR